MNDVVHMKQLDGNQKCVTRSDFHTHTFILWWLIKYVGNGVPSAVVAGATVNPASEFDYCWRLSVTVVFRPQ